MIKQPVKGTRNVSTSFFEAETRRIKRLNEIFFDDVELTQEENDVLVWLCGWDEWTIDAIISVFAKITCRGDVDGNRLPEDRNR